MAYIGNNLQFAFPSYRNIDDISGSFDGVTTSFALTVSGTAPVPLPVSSNQCLISVGGVVQRPDDSGTEGFRLSGGNIIFSSAPAALADFFGVILAGADYANAGANFPSGSASNPSITFESDLDTGLYTPGANEIGFTNGGTTSLVVGSTGQLRSGTIGSAGTPTYSFNSDPNTGVYSPGADQVAISTGGTGRLFIDSSGRVGLGTSSPGTTAGGLDISSGGIGLIVGADGNLSNRTNSTDKIFRVGSYHYTNSEEPVCIAFGQNLSSDNELNFGGGTAALNAATYIRWFTAANNTTTTGTERMRLDSSGRLGIGTTSPDGNLTIGGLTNTAGQSVDAINVNRTDGVRLFGVKWDLSSNEVRFSGNTKNYVFRNGSSEAETARIDSSGRLLVGTSTSITGANAQYGKLQSIGNTFATPGNGIIALGRSEAATSITVDEGIGAIYFTDNAGGEFALISCAADGTAGSGDYPGRLVFSTTADGASSPTEQMVIYSNGYMNIGVYKNSPLHRINGVNDVEGDPILLVSGYQNSGGSNQDTAYFYACSSSATPNAAAAAIKIYRDSATNRSINAAGTINASGADYAEYMVKSGDFTIAKGSIAGVNTEGKLTNVFSDAISFVVKSTDPSYVGGDTWHLDVGEEPGGYNDDRTEEEIEAAKTVYKQQLEDARQKVDRIAFAGQVPVNVMGATPGQYIVPIVTDDGGITGIAKDEADLTLAEYMRAVGKVIAIEDDGCARIIVKVA